MENFDRKNINELLKIIKFVNFSPIKILHQAVLGLDDNYQEVVITQWYCSYHSVLSFDVWLHGNIKTNN